MTKKVGVFHAQPKSARKSKMDLDYHFNISSALKSFKLEYNLTKIYVVTVLGTQFQISYCCPFFTLKFEILEKYISLTVY